MCDSTWGSITGSKSHENTSKYVDTVTLFSKNLNQGSLTPRWPLTHISVEVTCVTLPKGRYFQVPWKYIKVCGSVTLFSKTWTKGHWPLDDFWTHVCWGHMCDPNQGSLCPSRMGIHQCMWIQWSILQNDHILHTMYYVQVTELSSGETKMYIAKTSLTLVLLNRDMPHNIIGSCRQSTKEKMLKLL